MWALFKAYASTVDFIILAEMWSADLRIAIARNANWNFASAGKKILKTQYVAINNSDAPNPFASNIALPSA